jgi:hypothetical protein
VTKSPIREPDHIREDAVRKLRTAHIGGEFRAILGYLLDEEWTDPRLIEMLISPDGDLLARLEKEECFAGLFGKSADLLRCIHKVAKVVGLDGDEVGYLVAKVAEIKRLKE